MHFQAWPGAGRLPIFLRRNLSGQDAVKVRITPIDLVNNSYTNYFFCPAIYLVKMVPRCKPPPL